MIRKDLLIYLENSIRNELDSGSQKILLSKRGQTKSLNDNNLFFTLSLSHIIPENFQELKNLVNETIKNNLVKYKNKDGRITYNFWRTQPYEQYPKSLFLSKIKHFWIPDDLDCTALSYFYHSNSEVSALQRYLADHTKNVNLKLKGESYPYAGYSTWLGKKMSVEVDVCVLSNYLYMLYSKGVKLNKIEHEIELFLTHVIQSSLWVEEPFKLSPNYQKVSVIGWHLSRLINYFDQELKDKLILDIKKNMALRTAFEDKLFGRLSFVELGIALTPIPELEDPESIKLFVQNFSFFYASILTNSRFETLKKIAHLKKLNIPFISPGFNAALVLKNITSNG